MQAGNWIPPRPSKPAPGSAWGSSLPERFADTQLHEVDQWAPRLLEAAPELASQAAELLLEADEVDKSLAGYLQAATSDATRQAYETDWLQFVAWADGQDLDPLPADSLEVARYLSTLADAGYAAATVERRLAGIGAAHRAAGHTSPSQHPGVEQTIAGIRRSLGTAGDKKRALDTEAGVAMAAAAEEAGGLAGARDKALVLVGFAGGMRRSELVSLHAGDLTDRQGGLQITIRSSKSDQEAAGRQVGLAATTPRPARCGPCAAGLMPSAIDTGPVFRSVDRHGNLGDSALSGRSAVGIWACDVGSGPPTRATSRGLEVSARPTLSGEGAGWDMMTRDDEALLRALRFPRGRYKASRAAQLSGIPERTLYDWSNHGVLEPDFVQESPKMWSYRDLILLRMLYWLRRKAMDRDQAAERVRETRRMLTTGDPRAGRARTSGTHLHRGGDTVADSGQVAFEEIFGYLDEFSVTDAADAVGEVESEALWGPDLVEPTSLTRISPWVMAGDPCIIDTRIPTSTIYGLTTVRQLSPAAIVGLYAGLSREKVEDAYDLEVRLRGEAARVAA